MFHILLLLLTFSSLHKNCEGARILGMFQTPSYSHQVVYRSIWKELAKRGHEVVVITTDPENDNTTNVKEIDISFAYELWTTKYRVMSSMEERNNNPITIWNFALSVTLDIANQELLHPEVQVILKNKTEYFDVVMMELYPPMFGFASRFNCPSIAVTSLDFLNLFHSFFGNPTHPVAYPDALLPFVGELNFWERLVATLLKLLLQVLNSLYDTSREMEFMKRHFGIAAPFNEIVKNISMVFINVDPSTYTRPLGPSFIPIGGGIHLTPAKPLSQGLQEYLDNAQNGAIFLSLGTNVRSDMVPPELRKIMLDTFSELPYKILWKFDVTDIPDVPKNVKIITWLPQQDILRHPNIKLFVTQGGVQSLEEALFFNVPLVGIPFVGDQITNVKKMARKGLGVYLDKAVLTKESFKEAILEVINNPKYKQKAIEIAELSKDQPMTGLEKAVWWTEYVIRHKGAPHLRNPIVDLPFYQYYLLDVIGTVVATIVVLLYLIYKLFVVIENLIFRLISSKKVKQN